MLKCYKHVVSVSCNYCAGPTIKFGKAANGAQRYRCKSCLKTQLIDYLKNAYNPAANSHIVALLKEGCGIRSIARLLSGSSTTVIARIKSMAAGITKPAIPMNRVYELDELKTYVKNKTKECWVTYALDKQTGQVVVFKVGRRNKSNLKVVSDTLLLSGCRQIYTDKLEIYRQLIPAKIHITRRFGTNKIERKTLRCEPT